MISRILGFVGALVLLLTLIPSAEAAPWHNFKSFYIRSQMNNDIKAMHILDRPNRFGHFYGNTVRRMHYRKH